MTRPLEIAVRVCGGALLAAVLHGSGWRLEITQRAHPLPQGQVTVQLLSARVRPGSEPFETSGHNPPLDCTLLLTNGSSEPMPLTPNRLWLRTAEGTDWPGDPAPPVVLAPHESTRAEITFRPFPHTEVEGGFYR